MELIFKIPIKYFSGMDWLGISVFLMSYIGYPYFYHFVSSQKDKHTKTEFYNMLIKAVGDSVSEEKGRELLTRAFRVLGRILIFLGMVSFLSLSGGFGLFFNPARIEDLSNLTVLTPANRMLKIRFQLILFILLSGYAFLKFILCLIAMYNLTLVIHLESPDTTGQYIASLNEHFRRGVRTLYFIPVLFLWFVDPMLLIAGCLFIMIILYRHDVGKAET